MIQKFKKEKTESQLRTIRKDNLQRARREERLFVRMLRGLR